jgi:ketosteroid isomerase-like protein
MAEGANETRDLERMLRRFEDAENDNDANTLIEMIADDVVIMVPNYSVQVGKMACSQFIRDVTGTFEEHFKRHITYTSDEVRRLSDSHAFDRGTFFFNVAPKTGGETQTNCGKYLFLYSRSEKGSWEASRLIVSLDNNEGE